MSDNEKFDELIFHYDEINEKLTKIEDKLDGVDKLKEDIELVSNFVQALKSHMDKGAVFFEKHEPENETF